MSDLCDARRIADDHLSLVARLRPQQGTKLHAEGIARVEQLASAVREDRPSGIGDETFERLRQQARLQVGQRSSGVPSYELLEAALDPDGPRRGLALVPQPSEGDVFFDIEGDPFYEDGLEYLWGVTYREDGEPTFRAFWGRDRAAEGTAFRNFIDSVVERRRRYRDLADVLIGFANSDGGIVAVGLRDAAVEGTDRDPARRNAQIQAAIDFSSPPVRATPHLLPCVRSDGAADQLLIFEIGSSEGCTRTSRTGSSSG